MRLISAALLLFVTFGLSSCGEDAPSDDAMRDSFLAKRQSFETLRDELCKLRFDLTINRKPAWTQPQIRATTEKRLLAQLDEIGARGVEYRRGCQIWIEMWSSGVGQNAAYKKYRYGPPLFRIIEVKEPQAKDLNAYLDTRVRVASFQKHIVDDWWIELDHWR